MSSATSDGPEMPRLHTTRSFPRMDSPGSSPFIRSRAKTVQSVAIPESVDPEMMPLSLVDNEEYQDSGQDLFEKPGASPSADDDPAGEDTSVLSRDVANHPEELPIELISLTDRFVNSLTARVHTSPPTIDRITTLFQDFYLRAESHIATHISALASRINRDPSPYSPNSKNPDAPSRQMLTASEVTEKRTARKLLASKQVDLEEAVERRACESVYDKIWRHKSTLDDVRDEKLRSKTAALLLVGINLKELGVDIDMSSIAEQNQKDADECFLTARDYLTKMNEEKYPLGKLRHLAACHKAIVDALTKLLPSSSSADEILPALIYTLVTCPPEGISIISNLYFIQRFRTSSKVDGETAYCLTNLEAAISFLENVELNELRGEGAGEEQEKSPEDGSASLSENIRPHQLAPEKPISSVSSVTATAEPPKSIGGEPSATLPVPAPAPTQQGRLNTLPAKVLGAANDAVRNTADQGMKNISATLDSSFNFLFGRLKELQSNELSGKDGAVLPKTLAEARRLVTSPTSNGGTRLLQEPNPSKEPPAPEQSRLRRIGSRAEDTFNGLVSGQMTPRDRSADSARTQASSRASIAPSTHSKDEGRAPGSNSALSTPTLESVRSFGNTLNPLNHIPGMIRGFGRAAPESSASGLSTALPNRSRTASSTSDTKIDPPIQRFLQVQNANDLTIGDVSVLLEDYKRLSAALLKQASTSASK